MNVDPTDLSAVLVWLAVGAGSPFVINYALSLLVENWPAWHNLPRFAKFFAPLLSSVALSLGASTLLDNPSIIAELAPAWSTIVGAVIAWLGSQQAYMKTKSLNYAASAKKISVSSNI